MRNIDFEVSDENGEMIRRFRKKMKLRMGKLMPYAIRFADGHEKEFREWVKGWQEE